MALPPMSKRGKAFVCEWDPTTIPGLKDAISNNIKPHQSIVLHLLLIPTISNRKPKIYWLRLALVSQDQFVTFKLISRPRALGWMCEG
jgi:hypothetical protein